MSGIDYAFRKKAGAAIERDDVDALRVLLAGVDREEIDRIAYAASLHGSEESLRYMVGHLGVRVIRSLDRSLITSAITAQAPLTLIEFLLEQPRGEYALYIGLPLVRAAGAGRLDIVELLVEAGADINQGNTGFHNALELAISKGFEEIAKYLRDHGARPGVHNYRE